MNPGTIVGQYRILRQIGEGGMGAVFLAEHVLIGRRAAIKMLLPALSSQHEIVERFFNEARATTTISDPGIVQVFDFGFHADGSAFLVMEFLEGESLDGRIRTLGHLSVYDALRVTRQAASSLGAAHARGIVHRDLKPENIFLVRDAEAQGGERPKILDFGIAKLSGDEPGRMRTRTGALMGTPVYMSPEQCRGAGAVDHRSDIYSLGCVLYTMLTGRPPFDGEGVGEIIVAHLREPVPPPSSVAPFVPKPVDELVLRCLAKPVEERFQSMAELVAAIEAMLARITAPGGILQATVAMTPVAPGFRSEFPGAPAAQVKTASSVQPTTLSQTTRSQTAFPEKRSRGVWVALGVVLVGGGIAAAILAGGGDASSRPAPAGATAPPEVTPPPDAGEAAVAVIPDAGDLSAAPDASAEVADVAVDGSVPDAAAATVRRTEDRRRDDARSRRRTDRRPKQNAPSEDLYDTR